MLELGKALSFFLGIMSLYWAAISAFFVPGSQWQERLWLTVPKLIIAACVCLLSGLIFNFPARSNPDAGQPLTSTLPLRVFFWATTGITLLFFVSWYLVTGAPCIAGVNRVCA